MYIRLDNFHAIKTTNNRIAIAYIVGIQLYASTAG